MSPGEPSFARFPFLCRVPVAACARQGLLGYNLALRMAWERRGVAEKRDMLDDIIDIQDSWRAISNPLGGVADALAADPSKVRRWDPSEYKEVPRANSTMCLQVAAKTDEVCGRCLEVCPTAAIDIYPTKVAISADACRKCGLCSAVCPTGAFLTTRLTHKVLYDRLARLASIYEQVYVTCTRALGRLPKPNEVVLPCVGAIPEEVWFALLTDYDNINVYLPLGICDRCRTVTGEQAYAGTIAQAERLSGGSVGLEVDEGDLNHDQTRAYRRSQFVSSMARSGVSLVSRGTPVLAGAQAVAKRIKDHGQRMIEVQREIERAVGAKTDSSKRRIMGQGRKLVLTVLQGHPELAENIRLDVPVCDRSLCTMCGECVRACPVHACSLDSGGRFSVEPAYCLGCGACAVACPEDALAMEPCDPHDLVVRDPNAERRAERKAELREGAQEAKRRLRRGLDAIAGMADDDE